MSVIDWKAILNEAFAAAARATQEYLDSHPGEWYPCGFSWVNIKPARGALVQLLKDRGEGYTDTYYHGYTVHNPSQNSTQCMFAKEAGSRAFADVLKPHNIRASVCTRID